MPSNSLEFSVEDFFVRLFNADTRSAGKKVCHFDESDDAETKSIVVKAKQGVRNLAAFGGFDVEVEIEYRAPIGTDRAENDQVAQMLWSVIYASTIDPAVRAAMATSAGLSDLLIKDESSGERQNTNDLRKRTITLPVQAKLA